MKNVVLFIARQRLGANCLLSWMHYQAIYRGQVLQKKKLLRYCCPNCFHHSIDLKETHERVMEMKTCSSAVLPDISLIIFHFNNRMFPAGDRERFILFSVGSIQRWLRDVFRLA